MLLRKQDSAGVSALGYIYTHPAAQLLSFSQLQTAGEQDAFQRDHFLMVFILDFSGMISAFISFWWRGVGGRRRKKPRVGWHSSLVPMQKSVISSRHKRGQAAFLPPWALFAIRPGLCLGNRLRSHTALHKVIVSGGTYSPPAFFPTHTPPPAPRQSRAKGNIKSRREVFHWLWNLTWTGFWLSLSTCVILSNLFEFSESHLTY